MHGMVHGWWGVVINDVFYYLDGRVGIGEVGPEHWGSPGVVMAMSLNS